MPECTTPEFLLVCTSPGFGILSTTQILYLVVLDNWAATEQPNIPAPRITMSYSLFKAKILHFFDLLN